MQEKEFYDYGAEILQLMLERWPVLATQMGEHEQDGLLADYRTESIQVFQEKIKYKLHKLDPLDTSTYSQAGKIDYILLRQQLKSIIRDHEVRRDYQRNPNNYLEEIFSGVMSLILKDFAPVSQRLESLLSRIKQVPQVLNQARNNLIPEEVPPVWLELSLEQLSMASALFNQLIPRMAAENAPALKDELETAGQKAAQAADKFAAYLKNDLGYKADGEFAVGEEYFNILLAENHLVDYEAEELLQIGEEIFAETKAEMKRIAKEINPAKTVSQILAEAKAAHPSSNDLLDEYREAMKRSKEFVENNQVASIPLQEKLTIVETPPYLRPIIPYAAYMPPGIFADELEGLFFVTPVDPEAAPAEQEEKLRGHYYAKLPITTLHEGYPGHHLQLVYAAINGSSIRKLGTFLSTLFVEGWAFYCEELMEELGYIDDPVQKLGRLSDQLWRAGRIILDVKLHCQDMEIEDAVSFLVNECQLEKSNAIAEIKRYTSSPTQPQSYLMGKREILKIIEEYKAKHPGKDLLSIHDTILTAGSLPPKLLRRHLGLA